MKKLSSKLLISSFLFSTALVFSGCSSLGGGDSSTLTGLGQVARNRCRAPGPLYTKEGVTTTYYK